MSVQLGTGHIHSVSGATLACSLAGYVSPNVQSLKVSHSADRIAVKSMAGVTTGLIFNDDQLECTFEVIPEGTTIANAKLAAGIPAAGTSFTISGLAVITCGGIADALNGLWIYEGGGSVNGVSDDKWTLTMPMKRYPGISSGTAIII